MVTDRDNERWLSNLIVWETRTVLTADWECLSAEASDQTSMFYATINRWHGGCVTLLALLLIPTVWPCTMRLWFVYRLFDYWMFVLSCIVTQTRLSFVQYRLLTYLLTYLLAVTVWLYSVLPLRSGAMHTKVTRYVDSGPLLRPPEYSHKLLIWRSLTLTLIVGCLNSKLVGLLSRIYAVIMLAMRAIVINDPGVWALVIQPVYLSHGRLFGVFARWRLDAAVTTLL